MVLRLFLVIALAIMGTPAIGQSDQLWDALDHQEATAEALFQNKNWQKAGDAYRNILYEEALYPVVDSGAFRVYARKMADAYGRAGSRKNRFQQFRKAATHFEQRFGLKDKNAVSLQTTLRAYAEDFCEYSTALSASEKAIQSAIRAYGDTSLEAFVAKGDEWVWRYARLHETAGAEFRFRQLRRQTQQAQNELIRLYGEYYWARYILQRHRHFGKKPENVAEGKSILSAILAAPNRHTLGSRQHQRIDLLKLTALVDYAALAGTRDGFFIEVDASDISEGIILTSEQEPRRKRVKRNMITVAQAAAVLSEKHKRAPNLPIFTARLPYSPGTDFVGINGYVTSNVGVTDDGAVTEIALLDSNGNEGFMRDATRMMENWVFPVGYYGGSFHSRWLNAAEFTFPPLKVCAAIKGDGGTVRHRKKWFATGKSLASIRELEGQEVAARHHSSGMVQTREVDDIDF